MEQNSKLLSGGFIAALLVILVLAWNFLPETQSLNDHPHNEDGSHLSTITDSDHTDPDSNPESQVMGTSTDNSKKLPAPQMEIDAAKTYTAKIQTSAGEIVIALNAAQTPKTVNNFVYLARQEFYAGSPFHRVIEGFMIQGGDPTGTGAGGPGYRFDDEPFEGEYSRGTVAMANAGPNTNGSQFFIMHGDVPLPPNYVIFGKVTQGMEVVDKIGTAPVTMSQTGEESVPVEPVMIKSVEIVEK